MNEKSSSSSSSSASANITKSHNYYPDKHKTYAKIIKRAREIEAQIKNENPQIYGDIESSL